MCGGLLQPLQAWDVMCELDSLPEQLHRSWRLGHNYLPNSPEQIVNVMSGLATACSGRMLISVNGGAMLGSEGVMLDCLKSRIQFHVYV